MVSSNTFYRGMVLCRTFYFAVVVMLGRILFSTLHYEVVLFGQGRRLLYGVILCSTEWSLGAGSLAPVEMDGLCVSNSDRFRLCIAGGSFRVTEISQKRLERREKRRERRTVGKSREESRVEKSTAHYSGVE